MGRGRFSNHGGNELKEKRPLNRISLCEIVKSGEKVIYKFSFSEGLARYFSCNELEVTYSVNIESVPDSVLTVPFACSVIPLVWMTDSVLEVNILDADYIDCLENVKNGYVTMFPEASFGGRLEIAVSEKNRPLDGSSVGAAFFSGGLDAVNTLIKHLDEPVELISIWGSDIPTDNENGWNELIRGIKYYSDTFDLKLNTVKSDFRRFDNELNLNRDFTEILKDSWWHGVKHGIALIGHAAPLAYLNGWESVYIASSNCPSDGLVRCASSPLIDNHIRFCGCQVVHDSYEDNRQDKAHNVVKYSVQSGKKLPLHVCWETDGGRHCCKCEKCYRTITSFLSEGVDPFDFGIENWKVTLPKMRSELINRGQLTYWMYSTQWSHILNRICENQKMLRKKPYWKHIKWLVNKNMGTEKALEPSRAFRFRQKIASSPIGVPARRIKRFFKKR